MFSFNQSPARIAFMAIAAVCLASPVTACAPASVLADELPEAPPTALTAPTAYADLSGDQIAYRSFGSGPPVLLLNRLRGTLDTWDPLFLDTLATSHRVIIVDYPGVGYSSGDFPETIAATSAFVEDFAVATGLEEFVLLGWSWGGLAAQAYMLDQPERVSHLVLIGTAPPGKDQLPLEQVFLDLAFKPVNDLADEEVLFFEPSSPESVRAAKESHDRIYSRPGVAEKIPSTEAEIMAYLAVATEFKDDVAGRRDQIMTTRKPVLVITGDNDPSARAENWLAMVNQTASINMVVYPETGHAPQHEHVDFTVAIIEAFLQSASE